MTPERVVDFSQMGCTAEGLEIHREGTVTPADPDGHQSLKQSMRWMSTLCEQGIAENIPFYINP